MTNEKVQAILLLIIILLLSIMVFLPITIPLEEVITNGTVTGLHNKGDYFVYELKANEKIISGVISTNYYELDSEHTVWFVQNIINVTSDGKFV